MYNQGLNNEFCQFMEEKVKYYLYITLEDLLSEIYLFDIIEHKNFYEVKPLFNFDTVTSSNPKDHTSNKKVLILQKNLETTLTFNSTTQIMEYSEIKSEIIIDNIKYTLYYTYDSITNEPMPNSRTSNGNITDKYGYYLDSEVIT